MPTANTWYRHSKPYWFKSELVELNQKYQNFDKALYLTEAKDLIALHTPGHTNGHMSILLETDDCQILFASDLCYNQNQLIKNRFAGVNTGHVDAEDTYKRIKSLAKNNKLVFLPSHDREAGKRLKALVQYLSIKLNNMLILLCVNHC